MAKFIKSALKVGETFIDGNGKPVPVTTERLRHFSQQFGRLTKAGYIVPVAWDHASTLEGISPLAAADAKKSRSAKNTIGKLDSFNVAKDGKSAEVTLKISDPTAQGRAERNEVYISPVIMESWRDGRGTEYKDAVTHVDMVNHPVDHSQGPFRKLPEVAAGTVALAIRMGLDPVCTLMGDPPPKDDDDEEDDDEDGVPNKDDETPEGESDADVNNPERVSRVIEALKVHDLVLPEDTDGTNILERLEVALGVKASIEGKGDSQDPNDPNAGQSQVKVTDPGGFQGMSLDPRTQAAIAYAERQHRDSVKVRLKNLLDSGRCTPAEAAAKEPSVGVVKLSLDDKGNPEPSKLEEWIDSREAVPAGTFWDDKTRTANAQKLSLVPPPKHAGAEMTDEEAEAVVDGVFGKKPAK